MSERFSAGSLRERSVSPGVKRPTRVLNVLWPCKYLSVTHCWQMICRGSRRPMVSWEVGFCNISGLLCKILEREIIYIQVILCHYGFFQASKSMKNCDKEDRLTEKEEKWLKSLMQTQLPVWESLVLLGPDLGGGGETKEGHIRGLTAVLPTPGEMSASTRFSSGLGMEWQMAGFYKTKGR